MASVGGLRRKKEPKILWTYFAIFHGEFTPLQIGASCVLTIIYPPSTNDGKRVLVGPFQNIDIDNDIDCWSDINLMREIEDIVYTWQLAQTLF